MRVNWDRTRRHVSWVEACEKAHEEPGGGAVVLPERNIECCGVHKRGTISQEKTILKLRVRDNSQGGGTSEILFHMKFLVNGFEEAEVCTR